MSIMKYFNTISKLWQELDLYQTITWHYTKDDQLFLAIQERDCIFDFLQGLNVDLDEVRGRILGTKPLPTVNEAFAIVRRKESRKHVMMPHSKDPSMDSTAQGSALATYRPKNPKDLLGSSLSGDRKIAYGVRIAINHITPRRLVETSWEACWLETQNSKTHKNSLCC